MRKSATMLFLASIAMSNDGCSGIGANPNENGQPVFEVASSNPPELKIRGESSPLAPPMPKVLAYPPEYMPLYVASHTSRERNLLIGEHWIVVKLRDSSWFLEKEREDIETDKIIREQDLELLRTRLEPSLHRMVTPHTTGGKE